MDSCPVSTLDGEWTDIISMISMSEGGGMGGGFIPPSVLLEETQAYFAYRNIVIGEKNRIGKIRDSKKD